MTVPLSFIERRLRRLDPPAGADPIIGQADVGVLATSVVVVLGDPGAGKSVLMEGLGAAPGATFVRATSLVRMADPATRLGTFDRIVVDGVDEVASAVSGGGVDAVLSKLSALGNPNCILSCRAADWRGAADRRKLADDYGGDAIMLVLQPFDREDAARFLAVRFSSINAELALTHLDKRGLQSIYGNPLTLRLLGEAVAAGQPLPDSRGELLSIAVMSARRPMHSALSSGAYPSSGAKFKKRSCSRHRLASCGALHIGLEASRSVFIRMRTM